jgi:hypothetical protein
MRLQRVRLVDYVTLNFNNMSMAAVFLDMEKAFNTTWHSGLLHKLHELEFISSFLTDAKEKQRRKFPSSFLYCTVFKGKRNDAPAVPGINLSLFADDICIREKEA